MGTFNRPPIMSLLMLDREKTQVFPGLPPTIVTRIITKITEIMLLVEVTKSTFQ